MIRITATRLAGLALLGLFGACNAAAPTPASAPTYTFVWLKTGPRSAEHSAAERQTIFQGHMANMKRLADEKQLLVAGPFGQDRHDPADRGIFVFDAATVEQARALVETDPGVQSGEFRAVIWPMRASETLRRTPELERERLQGREWQPSTDGRAYQMLVVTDERAAREALAPLDAQGRVIWSGRFEGEGAGQGVFVLDATTKEEAATLIGSVKSSIGEHWIDPWFSSKSLESLPALRRPG